MSNIDQITTIVRDIEHEANAETSFPKKLTDLDAKEREEVEKIIRSPKYFLDWVETNHPEFSDLAIKLLDKVRYVSEQQMLAAAQDLAHTIETKAHGRKIVLLADFTDGKNRKSTWYMRELAGRTDWELEYPSEVEVSDNNLYVFFDDASLSGARAKITADIVVKNGVGKQNIFMALAGITSTAKKVITENDIEVVKSFEIPTIDQEFSSEEIVRIEHLSFLLGFSGGAERILTLMYYKVADNFWPPLRRKNGKEETYLVDDYKVKPPYHDNKYEEE